MAVDGSGYGMWEAGSARVMAVFIRTCSRALAARGRRVCINRAGRRRSQSKYAAAVAAQSSSSQRHSFRL